MDVQEVVDELVDKLVEVRIRGLLHQLFRLEPFSGCMSFMIYPSKIQVEEDNLYENDQTSVATTTTVQLENELTTQSGTKNDQKLEKETVPKIPQKDTEKNSPNNKNSKDPKQFEEEKELENIQSTSTTTIDCSDQSLQNLESQKSLKEKEVSHTEDKNDENFEEKVEENLIINEQMDAKESSKEEEVQLTADRRVKKIFKKFSLPSNKT